MKYKYTLEKDEIINLSKFSKIKLKDFIGKFGYIKDNYLIIYAGYSFDGSTGVPDTKRTYTASLIHDFLYQFRASSRKDADRLFYDRLKFDKFEFSGLYYAGVRLLGYPFYIF